MASAAAKSDPSYDKAADRSDVDILEELRERRTYATRAWEQVRKEGTTDVMCVAGDVWEALDPAGLAQREAAKRPHIAPDELGQYVNQIANDVRQNKRAIKVTPIDTDASDKTADFRRDYIRQVEYESNAQREVYSPIFEDALTRGYGFGRVVAKRTNPLSKNQKLGLEAFPNPDVVLVDPDGAMLSPDCAKIQYAFVLDSLTKKQFRRDFPNATVTDFTDDHRRTAPDWVQGERITVAEYWAIENVRRRVVFFKEAPEVGFYEYKIPGGRAIDALVDSDEWVDEPHVCQYLTNGIELLAKPGAKKRIPWPGASIPIFSCFGKVLYVQTGTGTERRLMSMVRLARHPFMAYCYTRTSQVEVIGSVPRATWVGYEGQFRGHENEWAEAAHVPKPFLVVKPFTTEVTGVTPLPLPTRQNWDPPLQNLEMQAEAFRRAIQAAMGTSPLPTEAQRQNQKSGKALDRIESSGQKGSYHFVDHLDGMITRAGVILNEQIAHRLDTKRQITVRKPDDQSAQVTINDPDDPESPRTDAGDHDITLSVGPAYTDERAAASDFADTIVGNEALLSIVGPQKAAELNALAIRLKAVGPIGDEMADIIAPKPPDGQAAPTPQQVAELQAQGQQLQQQNQELQTAVATDQAKQQGQIEAARVRAESDAVKAQADGEIQWRIAQLQAETELEKVRMQEATKLQIEEYKLRGLEIQAEIDLRQASLGAAQKDADRQAAAVDADLSRAHESEEAASAREASAEGAEAERAHAAEMAEAQRATDAAAAAGAGA